MSDFMEPPRISIIIVNWNTASLLRQCLAMIGPDEFDLIVVDNGSGDGSVEMCRADFPQARLVANPDNTGFARACNQGAREARGHYLFFLNSDALASAVTINDLADAMEAAGVHMAGPRLVLPGGATQTSSARRMPTPQSEFFRNIDFCGWGTGQTGVLQDYSLQQEVECVSGAAVMIRADVLRSVGGWPEHYFMYAEDIDLCMRVTAHGYRICYIPHCVVTHFDGGSSKGSVGLRLRRSWLSFAAMTRFFARYHGRIHALLYAFQYPVYMGSILGRAVCRRMSRREKRQP
ncbi:MAG: glycosyltransferase family 2 protein [Sulfuricella denitrificans]|nr:glycosyltransferase family 2 protein [Sulfuricella denitrificans]